MPTTKKKTYNRKTKIITLAEFRAWLEGVEELQPKGWVPDATQWKLIRNKIKCIVEPEPTDTSFAAQNAHSAASQQVSLEHFPTAPRPPQPVGARTRVPVPEPVQPPVQGGWESIGKGPRGPVGPSAPSGPSALDGLVDNPSVAKPMIAAQHSPPGLPAGQGLTGPDGAPVPGLKTPDIDTSDGTFESPFG